MANTGITSIPKQQKAITIPELFVGVNKFLAGSPVSNLGHAHPSADPTADGYFDWKDPSFTLFTRDMTPEILAMNPVVVIQRYVPNARNAAKTYIKQGTKRWTTPGNTKNNGLHFHGGSSATNRQGLPLNEIDNYIPITNTSILGYNHVLFDQFTIPVHRFVGDYTGGTPFQAPINRAVYVPEWNDSIVYTQHRRQRNYFHKFRVMLAVPNPDWTPTNRLNKYLFGAGQTIIIEPRLNTFNDGAGELEYYINWRAKIVN